MYQAEVKQVLQKEHKDQPTLIQKASYEAIRNGASVVGLAKTGTGKTLAYAIPVLERTLKGKANSVVILAPTTELAVQIRHAINPYLHALGLTGVSLVGAGNRKRQEDKLKKKHPEVVVATPGRFFDFFSANRIKTSQIKSLIIDEADDILEFAKLELLSALGQNLDPDSQILLFGATDSEITKNCEEIFARNFLLIDVRQEQKSTTKHYFLQVDNQHKIEFLQRMTKLDHFKGILFFDSNKTMMRFAGIFGHTKTRFELLANEFGKERREKALHDLATGKAKLLLATDLAARGLDIPGVTYVINFDIPSESNTYLHRAGRTGRMNAEGYVVTLGDDHDFRDLKKLMADEVEIKRVYFAGYHLTTDRPKKKAKHVEQQIEKAVLKKKKKRKKHNKNKGYHPHYLKGKK
ncbi:DEAD/DEAH box helicase [Lactobacillus kefiranofaciens]|uniref:DEAD/DEAH box helicase n=1 Tax=Lactobacillus kefiranofaciens TaxID=267818 RepID=A0AAX3UEP2_9LACO|nr:DEAD/DEAH box helicase [Lactobacillus kefiranofaciens]AEG40724.1 ATP-dependent RNA helicase, DEAD-DEAH box [Lactobacillus kefiranofaciens subsp. kefiranofaciens]KRM22756.1 ATP-dependent RNA helicase [Lactobacillus kefiranofaciens subsp. kefiranofaciens DSM 5016 = JCM 6985]QFQ68240.1 DEAD/DEAH box helicase [Lactobacillus kefiranofaciens subsp. kefiranofaciens]WGO85974.1 DEAD/DEAH box helicase [Lactobacillus kefiranofaciens]WQH36708.1 DEAD/DEAH box helicase [Lactobacillus kefiranofaciens]